VRQGIAGGCSAVLWCCSSLVYIHKPWKFSRRNHWKSLQGIVKSANHSLVRWEYCFLLLYVIFTTFCNREASCPLMSCALHRTILRLLSFHRALRFAALALSERKSGDEMPTLDFMSGFDFVRSSGCDVIRVSEPPAALQCLIRSKCADIVPSVNDKQTFCISSEDWRELVLTLSVRSAAFEWSTVRQIFRGKNLELEISAALISSFNLRRVESLQPCGAAGGRSAAFWGRIERKTVLTMQVVTYPFPARR
jgi:hypothetical protein